MTVCIAAVCEDGKKIVAAADRMFTNSFPVMVEFETEESKLELISSNCVAIMSGNSGYGTEVLFQPRKDFEGRNAESIVAVTDAVLREYVATRLKKVDETIIVPALGHDYDSFLTRGGTLPTYLQTQPQLYQQLVAMTQQYDLGLEIIVAGIDDTGAHISLITHPGTFVSLDKLGYHTTGSGGIHALTRLNLSGQTRRRNLVQTLYSVYESKKAAEVAPGVGKETDLMVIEQNSGSFLCPEAIITELESMYTNTAQKSELTYDKLDRLYDEQRKNP